MRPASSTVRAQLRYLARVVAVATAGIAFVVTLVLTLGVGIHVQRTVVQAPVLPTAAILLLVVLLAVMAGVAVFALMHAAVELVNRRILEPLHQLSSRAQELGTGGYALDPVRGRRPDPDDWSSGLVEVDSVARVMEHHYRSMDRALSSERSFAADASHQLRTPLAALLMRLEEIAEADDIELARSEADVAIVATERLARVVDDLLFRTRAGHADGGRSVSLDTVLSAMDQEWARSFEAEGRELHVEHERGMIVRCSSSALGQVLNTLLENSLKYGGGTVLVSARRSGPSAVVEVADDGPGVHPEVAPRIFERSVTTGGTGLGLPVARETAESFGGRLELVRARPVLFALYVSMASPVASPSWERASGPDEAAWASPVKTKVR